MQGGEEVKGTREAGQPLSRSDPYLDRTRPAQRLCHRPRSVRAPDRPHLPALSCACGLRWTVQVETRQRRRANAARNPLDRRHIQGRRASVRGAAGSPTGPATRSLHLRLSSEHAEPRLGPRLGARPRLRSRLSLGAAPNACPGRAVAVATGTRSRPAARQANGSQRATRRADNRVWLSAASPSHMQRLLGER